MRDPKDSPAAKSGGISPFTQQWTGGFVKCPSCSSPISLRSEQARVDSLGFEIYRVKCKDCGAMLIGLIDPYDESLLLSLSNE
jgi:hypothetical protein